MVNAYNSKMDNKSKGKYFNTGVTQPKMMVLQQPVEEKETVPEEKSTAQKTPRIYGKNFDQRFKEAFAEFLRQNKESLEKET